VDIWVKGELARTKALNVAKIARLKGLRLARDEQEANADASQPRPRKTTPPEGR
jgi:hypothetical protein